MLVLTRKSGETIRIGQEVTVQVISVQGNRVRLGISCPRSIGVLRGELELQYTGGHCEGAGTHVLELNG